MMKRSTRTAVRKLKDANGNYLLNQPGNAPYNLVQIPKLGISGSSTISDSKVSMNVTFDESAIAAGLYLDPSCSGRAPEVTGYRVRAQGVPLGDSPPDSRDRNNWTDVSPNGNVIGLGDGAVVEVDCAGDTDVYLAASLVFNDGFESSVGENSTRAACGPNIADPDDLQQLKPSSRPGRKPGRKKG